MSTITINRKHFDNINIEEISVVVIEAFADVMVAEIVDNWSPTSPSSPHTAPAIDTGRLNRETRRAKVMRMRLEFGTPYAVFLEYGTRRMLPRPFVRPAFYRALKSDVLAKRLKKELE